MEPSWLWICATKASAHRKKTADQRERRHRGIQPAYSRTQNTHTLFQGLGSGMRTRKLQLGVPTARNLVLCGRSGPPNRHHRDLPRFDAMCTMTGGFQLQFFLRHLFLYASIVPLFVTSDPKSVSENSDPYPGCTQPPTAIWCIAHVDRISTLSCIDNSRHRNSLTAKGSSVGSTKSPLPMQ